MEFPTEPTFDSSVGMLEFPESKTYNTTAELSTVKTRAQNYDLALGTLSPGTEQIEQELMTNDPGFRQQKTMEYDAQFSQQRDKVILDYIRTKDPSKPYDEKVLADLRTMTQNDLSDPETFLETMYAKKVANWEEAKPAIMQAAVASSYIGNAAEDFKEQQSRVTNLIGHKEIARNFAEELKVRLKEQSYFQTGVEMVQSMIPGVDWAMSMNQFSKQDEFMKGGNIQAQIADFYSLPPSKAKEKMREMIENLTKEGPDGGNNLLHAYQFVHKFIEYGNSDAALDSFMGTVDIAATATAQKTMRAVARGLLNSTAKPEINMVSRAFALGNQDKAVNMFALDILKSKAKVGAASMDDLEKTAPTLFNSQFYDDAMQSIPAQAAREQAELLARNQTDEALQALAANPRRISRMEEEATQLANAQTVGKFYDRYPTSSDGVLNVVPISNLDQASNVNSVEIMLGNLNKKMFAKEELAKKYAEKQYGLSTYEIKQAPAGPYWYISTKVDVAEGNLYNLTVPVPRRSSGTETVLGWLSGADRALPKSLNEARRQVVYGSDIIIHKVQALGEPLKAVRKDQDFSNFLLHNHINEKTYSTASEMETAWAKQFGKLPNEAQVKAYDAAVRLDEVGRLQENMLARSALVQRGIEQHTLKVGNNRFKLLGKYLPDGLELPKKNGYVIGFHDANDTTLTTVRSTATNVADMNDLVSKGYKVVQLTPDAKKALVDMGEEYVDYVVTRAFKTDPVPFDLVKKRSGFQKVADPDTIYISQPNIARSRAGGAEEQIYHGNSTLLHTKDAKAAEELTKNLEIARKLMNANKIDELDQFVAKHLPPGLDTATDFGNLFVKDFNRNVPFYSRKMEDNGFDRLKAMRNEDDSSVFPNLYQGEVSEHNLYRGMEDLAHSNDTRDLGMGVLREGTDANPIFKATQEQVLSPMAALEKSVEDISRSVLLEDYKIKSAKDFVEKYHSILNVPIEELRADPWKYMLNPQWTDNADKALKAQAKNALMAHTNLLGIDSPAVFSLKKMMSDAIGDTFGNDVTILGRGAKYVANSSPVNAAKNFAFHTTQGLFAIPTAVAQAMNVTSIMAIHPKNGLQGASAAIFRNMGRAIGDEKAAKAAELLLRTEGWKKGEYTEALNAYYASGFDKVSRFTMTDAASSPAMRQGRVGDFVDGALDVGITPLKAGEAINRDTAWFTAYKNWRDDNPVKAFNQKAQAEVLLHADVIAGNMSRASRAQWDSGVLSVATQFKSWYGRQVDLLTGNQLTTAQKWRLIGASTITHGAVSGGLVGVGVGTVWPAGQAMRKYLNEQNVDTDDIKVSAVINGGMSAVIEAITGEKYAFAEKYGPGQNDMFKNLWNGNFVKALGGPSGNLIIKAFEGHVSSEALKLTKDLIDGKPSNPQLLAKEITDWGRTIRSVNDVATLYNGLTLNKLMTKNGITADVTTQETWMKFFSGMTTARLQDIYDKGESLSDFKKYQKGIEDGVRKDLNNMYRYALSDPKLAAEYQTRAYLKLEQGQFTQAEKTRLIAAREADSVIGINARFGEKFPGNSKSIDRSILTYEQIKKRNQ